MLASRVKLGEEKDFFGEHFVGSEVFKEDGGGVFRKDGIFGEGDAFREDCAFGGGDVFREGGSVFCEA